MNRARKLILERGMDPALALHPRKAFESRGHQSNMKMGFARAAVGARGAGMPAVAGALILDLQRFGRKSCCQFFPHAGGNAHKSEHLSLRTNVKQYVSLSFTLSIP